MKHSNFWLATGISVVVVFAASRFVSNDYFFFAGYVVLQYIVLAEAWNIEIHYEDAPAEKEPA